MNKSEALQAQNPEQPIDAVLSIVVKNLVWQEKAAFWSNALNEYKNVPKQTGRERKHAKNIIRQTASKLLKNPQDISMVEDIWKRNESGRNGAQESEETFSKLVKAESLALIKDKWQKVTPEQLAQLVKISSDDDGPSQEFAKEMLRNYFKGPEGKRQRIETFSNLAYSVLDLAGDDKALDEGVKIALYGTDILPKDPFLIEQAVVFSMPYDEEEEDFKTLIIANHVINQVSIVRSREFVKYHRANANFVRTDEKAIRGWNRKREKVTKQIGRAEATELNNVMMGYFRTLRESLSEDMKERLKEQWPYSVAFDENDPLNQKFERVRLQLASGE